MRCKDCKFYSLVAERDDRFKNKEGWDKIGECSMELWVENITFPIESNRIITEDRSYIFVGENFGCIHFKEKSVHL